jgi:hypothetical protein
MYNEKPSNGFYGVRVSEGQLRRDSCPADYSNTASKLTQQMPNSPSSDNYLQSVNDQLFRMNHERMRRQMSGFQPINRNFQCRGEKANTNSEGQQNEYGINQSNNVNINLTLALVCMW